jgi:hypothetical protein
MDSLFKQKLLNLRNPKSPKTFGEALLGDGSWLKKVSPPAPQNAPEVYSEKVQVIESLERFVEEKVSESTEPVLKIPGGEVVLREEPQWGEVTPFASLEDLKASLKLDQRFQEIALKNKRPTAIFVSEKFRPWEESEKDLKGGFIDELLLGFPPKTAELFERMILAMKLTPEEVVIYPVEGEEADFSQDVFELAGFFKPEVIITLGAKATTKILKSSDRLSMIHGQFFQKRAGEQVFQVVPLFHPSIIETNQNMKKTAWSDMQKIMKHLKKLP